MSTGIFIIHQNLNREKFLSLSLFKWRLLAGSFLGGFGVVLMQFGIHVDGDVLIDLRTVAIMIAAYLGGWVSALVAAFILIICRLTLYPVSFSALINVLVLTASTITFSIITQTNMGVGKKWSFMAVSYVIVLSVTIHIVIPDIRQAFLIFIQYSFSILSATYGTYMLGSYLWRNDQENERLKQIAQKDHLTGLNNVRSFTHSLDSAFLHAHERQEDLSLLYIDIDYFKKINDTYGHPAGDKVLQQVSKILTRSCRSVDIVSRNGGEEFSVIMPACGFESARIVAERIRQSIEQTVFVINKEAELRITVSIGHATAKQVNSQVSTQLIKEADEGLYLAKRTGRNRVCYFENYQYMSVSR
nr:diguanylate cyclase [Neobacillus terrae]